MSDMSKEAWIIGQQKFICQVRGDIGVYNTITFHIPGLEKMLCMHCYIEKLIEIGVCEVTEKKP
jgi:hypothetical protein